MKFEDAFRIMAPWGLLLAIFVGYSISIPPDRLVGFVVFVSLLLVLFFHRFDYLDPAVAYSVPWLAVLLFSAASISVFSRPVDYYTYLMVLVPLAFFFILSSFANKHKDDGRPELYDDSSRFDKKYNLFLIAIYFALSIINVVSAGYVPFVRGLQTGDTGYMDFGLRGFYGLYNAYANSLAILQFFLYLTTRKRHYLYVYWIIMVVFVLFYTRQNIISVLVESLVIYSFIVKRVSIKKLIFGGVLSLFLFALAGEFRSGDIKGLVGVREEYSWLPGFMVWVYAYSYFNILNLDNMIKSSGAPFWDGSSLSQVIPSFLRPDYMHDSYVEVASFTVSSYVYPIYQDLGAAGVVVFSVIIAAVTVFSYNKALRSPAFLSISFYSVLYFCALFSFFVNFWFYLPIIFQLFFFKIFACGFEKRFRLL